MWNRISKIQNGQFNIADHIFKKCFLWKISYRFFGSLIINLIVSQIFSFLNTFPRKSSRKFTLKIHISHITRVIRACTSLTLVVLFSPLWLQYLWSTSTEILQIKFFWYLLWSSCLFTQFLWFYFRRIHRTMVSYFARISPSVFICYCMSP